MSSPTGGNFFFAIVKSFEYKTAIYANFVKTVKNSSVTQLRGKFFHKVICYAMPYHAIHRGRSTQTKMWISEGKWLLFVLLGGE